MSSGQTHKEALALVHETASHKLSLESLPVPLPNSSDDHLIRVHTVALTNGELDWPEPATQKQPIPGYEMAGVVEMAPHDSPFPQGAEVYARTDFGRQGSSRLFSIAKTSELGRKPANISWEEAATVPLSALTAWQALFVHGRLTAPTFDDAKRQNSSKRVLVTAGAGGVGLWVVQLAKLAGAFVVSTSGPSNIDFVKGLGADEVLNYRNTNLQSWVASQDRRFDLVIDCVGGNTLEQAWTAVAESGIMISVAMPASLKKPAVGVATDIKDVWFIVSADMLQLSDITRLLEDSRAKAYYDSTYDLADFQSAFQKATGGHLRGKVVLKIS